MKLEIIRDFLENGEMVQMANTIQEAINKLGPSKRFKKPALHEIADYCLERDNGINPAQFYDFYEAKDWMIGKNKMKSWQAAIRTWERNRTNSIKKSDYDG